MELSRPDPQRHLWRQDGFFTDEWIRADTIEVAPEGPAHILLPLAEFLAAKPHQSDSTRVLGVELLPGEAIDEIIPFLPSLKLIALAFPAFNDGRSYSKATLLRDRYGFSEDIRATGDVLIDQIAYMIRCGFSSFEIESEIALRRLAEGKTGGLPLFYQGAVISGRSASGFSWRRRGA